MRRLPSRRGVGAAAIALGIVAVAATSTAPLRGQGPAIDGVDVARVLTPPGAEVRDVELSGYRLARRGRESLVVVDASPLGSRAPYLPVPAPGRGAVERLARAVALGAATEYEAASRVLAWVARHVVYDLDRALPQDAAAVLARRAGYCTGVARLTVALLTAAGLEAREVVGWVARTGPDDPAGFHRWIEVRFADRGWVMSDPLRSHHYVPATYVRLASDRVAVGSGLDGILVARNDRIEPVDVHPFDAAVPARRNDARQRAGALKVLAAAWPQGTAVLEGRGARRTRELRDGSTTFVGLEPGTYRVRLLPPEGPPLVGDVELSDHLRTAIRLTLPPAIPRAATIGSPE